MLLRSTLFASIFVLSFCFLGCDDDSDSSEREGGDYSACENTPLKNQVVTCDELKWGIEDYCGFSLTVDACSCAAEIEGCTTDVAWLEQIIACGQNANDCTSYVTCLEALGESPSGCAAPVDWECLVIN